MKRQEALRLGMGKYEADAPCRKNPAHGYRRYTTSGACVACATAAARNAYQRPRNGGGARLPPVPDHPVSRSDPIDGKFFTGRRCSRGHLAWRYASTGACVYCNRVGSWVVSRHALNVINAFRSLGPATVVWTDREPPAGLPEIDRRGLGANRVTAAPCFIRYPDTPGMLDLCKALGMVPIDEYVRNL